MIDFTLHESLLFQERGKLSSNTLSLIVMKAATPRGLARVEDPGLSIAKEAAKAVPPRKASAAMKIPTTSL
jgi:hypothetical protein